MTRRVASKVHQQVSRLVGAGLLKSPPWLQAVIDHPPLPLPPKVPARRDAYDLPPEKPSSHSPTARHIPTKHLRPPKALPLPIHYLEDRVRRQFFKDRPFEAFRAVTLVEEGRIEEEHSVRGHAWTRLRQRGRNPIAEDAIRFAVHLHQVHKQPLTSAYRAAVTQFDALRSEQYIMTRFAVLEAEAHGAVFVSKEIERGFKLEERALESWEVTAAADDGANAARKRWKAVAERRDPGEWTGGRDYVRLWKQGTRPNYSPMLSSEDIPPSETLDMTKDENFVSTSSLFRS
ncbi:mitochondrial ribosomal protein S25-domain-containing protein [Hysterangium stoloniferum]|nr:mitochondrial ribosomal protein S25-domain-containing protein [Hysterangium stoloniferum]